MYMPTIIANSTLFVNSYYYIYMPTFLPIFWFLAMNQRLTSRAPGRSVRESCRAAGREPGVADLYAAVMEGAVERVRPKMMTVVAIMAGLLPILWGTGTGSEVMSRIAAPMVGGMISSTVLTLAVIPAIYALVQEGRLRRGIG
ncbi:efflux RND transporter permease subunit, partial [Accumulibacter sp.]|uniref:efflux RND transporter permease subunit n=1 Tax=Accumulibacter sp. TaxID=2053492 RepID=UPI002585FDD1